MMGAIEEKARLAYWEKKKEHVKDLLQQIMDKYYESEGKIVENVKLPQYGSICTLPNIALVPKTNHMNLDMLVVSVNKKCFFTLFKKTYSSGRFAVRDSVREERLHECMELVIGTFLYPPREEKKEKT